MVRYLAIASGFRRTGGRLEPVSDDLVTPLALLSVESARGGRKTVTKFSPVVFPIWAVQVTPHRSLLVAASGGVDQTVELTDRKRLNEFRRILTTEIHEAADVVKLRDRLLSAVEHIDKSVQKIGNVVPPELLQGVGALTSEADLSSSPNLMEMRTDSQKALSMAEEYKRLLEACRMRVDTLEELRRVAQERLGSHITVLDNVISSEKGKWDLRLRQAEERVQQDSETLRKQQKDMEYSAREKQKMELRALTAELSRSMGDIERFFEDILERVRSARAEVGQCGDNVVSALSRYGRLTDEISKSVPRYAEVIRDVDRKSDEIRRSAETTETRVREEISRIDSETQKQLAEKTRRVEQTRQEMDRALAELNELRTNVKNSADRVLKALDDAIGDHQSEFLRLTSLSIESSSIAGITPLTQIQIHTYVGIYEDNSYAVVVPMVIPEDRIGERVELIPVDKGLEQTFRGLIDQWMLRVPGFRGDLMGACTRGNLFTNPEGREKLSRGLSALQSRQLLREGVLERVQALWDSYSGRCPKCGAETRGAKFCPKCGQSL